MSVETKTSQCQNLNYKQIKMSVPGDGRLRDVPLWLSVLVIGTTLILGTCVTLSMKIMYSLEGRGIAGEVKPFKKPWFTAIAMFVGMSVGMVIHLVQRWRERVERKRVEEVERMEEVEKAERERLENGNTQTGAPGSGDLRVPMLANDQLGDGQKQSSIKAYHGFKEPTKPSKQSLNTNFETPPKPLTTFGIIWRCAIPSVCDMTATGTQAVGLLYVTASVYQMFRGTSVVFEYFLLTFKRA